MEVSYYLYSRGFKVRLPSQLYLNKTEGLCGNCNSHLDDDLMDHQVGLSWLVSKLLREPPTGQEDLCQIAPQPECTPLNPGQDPCLKLVDSDLFKVKLDPRVFVSDDIIQFELYNSRCAMLSLTHCPTLRPANMTRARAAIQCLPLALHSNPTLVNAPVTRCVYLGARLNCARLSARLAWNTNSAVLVVNLFADKTRI